MCKVAIIIVYSLKELLFERTESIFVDTCKDCFLDKHKAIDTIAKQHIKRNTAKNHWQFC